MNGDGEVGGAAVACLLFAGFWLLAMPRRVWPTRRREGMQGRWTIARVPFRWRRPVRVDRHDIPLFVHQLTGLLQAGRTPLQLWEDALSGATGSSSNAFSAAARPVLEAAHQAAVLGLSVPQVLRNVSVTMKEPALRVLWADLASCLDVADRSGAPLAGVLARYAVQCESQLDSDAARDTALAGPRATVRLLSWLPLFGLGVGYLIGADPLAVLLGSTPGVAALCAGAVLMVAGRIWSKRLVQAAAGNAA